MTKLLRRLPGFSHPQVFYPRRIIEAAQSFVAIEASSGMLLVAAALAGLVWANSPAGDSYVSFWHSEIVLRTPLFSIEEDLQHLVNDGLMTLFFFLMGLEIKRELVHGELSSPRRAMLPAVAAFGGMLAPAVIYLAFNPTGEGSQGWGVPMATDIAFSLGVLSLLGRRVPFSAKVFLLALAIADDIGAVIVIAIFYTANIDVASLLIALGLIGVIAMMARMGVRDVDAYLVLGAVLWIATYESGIHATLAGVALGMLTPARSLYAPADYPATATGLLANFRNALAEGDSTVQQGVLAQAEDLSRNTEAPLDRVERALHPWVSYAVVPVFALANAGVVITSEVITEARDSSITHGVALGLLLGKPLGIVTFTWLATRLHLCDMPTGARWGHILGIGLLGGIGFTVSLLIAGLAFEDPALADEAKLGILASSVLAAVLGYVCLRFTRGSSAAEEPALPGAQAGSG